MVSFIISSLIDRLLLELTIAFIVD